MKKKSALQEGKKTAENAHAVPPAGQGGYAAEMRNAVQRLRTSRDQDREEAHDAGYNEGFEWATAHASWTELDFLASDEIDGCNDERDAWVGLLEELPSLQEFIEGYYREEWRLLAHALPSDFAAGFRQGALEVWRTAVGSM